MLSRDDYRARDGLGLAELVRRGEVSAGEVLEAAIAEIERLDPALNAIVMRNYEKAREDALAVGRMVPLAGVPFPAKDINVHVAGFPTTHACRFFAGAPVESDDSLLVSRWRAAGLVVPVPYQHPGICDRFRFASPNSTAPPAIPGTMPARRAGRAAAPPPRWRPAWCRWRTPPIPAGRSACRPRAAASSASSRRAASSPPARRSDPWSAGSTATTRSPGRCAISAALLDATAGPERGAPCPYARPAGSFLAALERPVGALRMGVAAPSPGGEAPATEIAGRLEATAHLLAELGHEVRPWSWPATEDASDAASVFWISELAAEIAARAATLGRDPRAGELGPLVAWSVAEAARIDSVQVADARRAMRDVQVRMARSFEEIDVLLTPVTAEPPLQTGVLTDCIERGNRGLGRALPIASHPTPTSSMSPASRRCRSRYGRARTACRWGCSSPARWGRMHAFCAWPANSRRRRPGRSVARPIPAPGRALPPTLRLSRLREMPGTSPGMTA